MSTAILVLGAFGYFGFGLIVALAITSSLDIRAPKWLAVPLIVLLWPLAIFLPVVAVVAWMKNGSH
jgi:hypothetical protein